MRSKRKCRKRDNNKVVKMSANAIKINRMARDVLTSPLPFIDFEKYIKTLLQKEYPEVFSPIKIDILVALSGLLILTLFYVC
ncbi:hypothetical protein CPIN17261_0870 [Campylobacter pinnipediorum subsp. pinnipediorum]|uniref:Uncharacterized protein n=2 Tax=Campylobacter TaxID=194 RepID=A0AAX0LAI4_9BACT|nr:hypothetical protein [Campylobacter pinnipediorum]AQW81259.1 hypothetical protein CPIN17260_0962 [Campylobacter pinnipediorum subsp. pinnipediorum]AQW82880.1 hypothetical protein CPIN17261_0870 [Campylobacter pinnipediorum subsp. pinnipediorum]OPA77222.1 hypothetical protein BFG04_03765 [Campylobacter pinnipediorum subsp. pinnipediorum]